MSRAIRATVAAISSIATVAALAATPGTVQAATTANVPATTSTPGKVFTATDHLAGRLATAMADPAVRSRIASATESGSADLFTLEAGTSLGKAVRSANQAVLAAKGLPSSSGSMLRLRLATPRQRAALTRGAAPLVAAEPSDDTLTTVTAYDQRGAKVLLDPVKVPQRPVLVVEVDVAKALPIGVKQMRSVLAARGVGSAKAPAKTGTAGAGTAGSNAARPNAAGGYWTTKVDMAHLTDDEEPWAKGDAEIYSIVGGFGLDGNAAVNIVQMPYLDNDHTYYYPNQILISWNAYKYNLADVVMMEEDGDTNYQALAAAIATALLTITDQGAYIPLVNPILSAIPASWWTDDPDYVDSWYTLSVDTNDNFWGAAHNGFLTLSPYWVSEI